MSTFAERFINQGMQQGLKQGMQQGLKQGMQQGLKQGMQQGLKQGMQQGEANVLLRLLALKFGEISEDRKKLIQSADSESLLKWTERVLFADSIDEVLQQ